MIVLAHPQRWRNVTALAFDPGGGTLAAGYSGYGISSWDLSGPSCLGTYRIRTGAVFGIGLESGGRRLCVPAGYDGALALRYPGLREVGHFSTGGSEYIRFAVMDGVGRRVAHSRFSLAGGSATYGIVGGLIREDGRPAVEWVQLDRGWVVNAATYLPGGRRLVTVDEPHRRTGQARIAVRDVTTGVVQSELPCPPRELHQLAAAPDSDVIALRAGRSVWVWNLAEANGWPEKITNTARQHFTDVAFHPSGRYVATAANDGVVKLWDAATGEPARAYTWPLGRARSVAFSPDGTLAAAGSDTGRVVVWDVDV